MSVAEIKARIAELVAEGTPRDEATAIAIRQAYCAKHGASVRSPDAEVPEITLEMLLDVFDRIAITGAPRCGKSTIAGQVIDRGCHVIHTDPNDIKAAFGDDEDIDWEDNKAVWAASPAFIGQMCAGRERFLVEGVTVARALRRKAIEVDCVVVCSEPLVMQTPEQQAMGTGILEKILPEWQEENPDAIVIDGGPLVPKLVTRYTRATLDAGTIQRTQQGGIRVRARVTKVGVFDYNRDGKHVREYRPPEEVLDQASWGTLKGATVVIDHPYDADGEVRPDNWKELTVGHCEDPEPDTTGVWCWLNINDAKTIEAIGERKLKEVSCGYENWFDEAPGKTPTGEKYDRVQRGIRYNHVALGPPGWGRQGGDVALSLDAKDNELPPGHPKDDAMKTNQAKPSKTTDSDKETDKDKTTDSDMPSALTDEEISALKSLASLAPQLAAMVQAQAAPPAPAAAPAAPAPAPAAPAVPVTQDQQPAAAAPAPVFQPPPKTLDASDVERLAAERADLQLEAQRVIGEAFSAKGKSSRQIRCEVIKTVDSKWNEKTTDGKDRSDDDVNASYSFALKMHAERAEGRRAIGDVRSFSTDSGEPEPQIGDRAYSAWEPKRAD